MPHFGKIVIVKRSKQDGNSFPLVTDTCIIGRDKDCDIRIQFPTVSAQHCAIEVRDANKVYVKQMSNSSLTLLNGVLLKNEKLLKHKDVITIADRCFRFEYPVGSEHRTSVSPLSSWNCNKTPKSSPLSIPSSAGRTPRPPPIALSRKRTKSPQKSPEKLTPRLPFRSTRKSVSFGPLLSPEQFHDDLPPSTPVKRGRQPSIQGLTELVSKSPPTKPTAIEKSPQVGLKRKLSPTSVFETSPSPVHLHSAKKRARSSSQSPTLLGDSRKRSKSPLIRKSSKSPLSRSKMASPSESEKTNTSLSESLSSEKSVSSLSPKSPRMAKRRSSASRKLSGSVGRRNASSRFSKSSVKTPTRVSKGPSPRASFSRKTPVAESSYTEKSGRRPSRVEQVPKIVAPDSPDSKKSKALITIHAPQLRSKIKTNKTSKSIRKPLFSGVLKLRLNKNPPTSARKKKAAKKLVALAIKKRPPIKKRALKMQSALKKKKLERTDPVISPKSVVADKKPSRTPRKSIAEKSPIKRPSSVRKRFSSSVNTEVSYFRSPNVTREVFVSPLNTPKNASVKKSKIVEQYLKDSAASLFGLLSSDSPKVSSDEWLDLTPELIAKDRMRRSKTRLSAKVDYTNVSGIRTLFTRKSSSANYSKVKGLKPKNSPVADYTNVSGVKELFKTRTALCADYKNLHGLRNMFRTPQASPKADYTNVSGMKKLFRASRSTPVADYRDIHGLKKLFRTPRSSPKADYTNVRGVKKLMQLPSSPMGDYTNVSGVKMLMRTPRSPPEINYEGVKELFVSPSSSLRSGSAKANRSSSGSPAKSVPKRSRKVPKKVVTTPRKSPQRKTRRKEKSSDSLISPKGEKQTAELENKEPALPKRGATVKSPETVLPAKRIKGQPKKESRKSPGRAKKDGPKPGITGFPEATAESKELGTAVASRPRRKRGAEISIKQEYETPEVNTVTPPKRGKRGKKVKEVAVEKVSPSPPKVTRTRGAAAKKVAVVAEVEPAAAKKKTKSSKKVPSKKKVSKVTRASSHPNLSPVPELSESTDMGSRAATPKATKARKRGKKEVIVSTPTLRPKRSTRQSKK